MITWLIGSMLLSAGGGLLYLLMGRFLPQARLRKQLIYLILGLSILLPLFISPQHVRNLGERSPVLETNAATSVTFPSTVEEYCHCSDPEKSEVLAFQASRLYDLILNHGNQFLWFFLFISCLMFIREGYKVLWVRNWLRAHADPQANEGINTIRSDQFGPAASLRLFHKYIFLGKEADSLPERERQAVLLHEKSHLDQANTWEELALGLLKTVWYLHPAFYFFRRELRHLSEFIADEAALESNISRREYALLLLKLKSSTRKLPFQHFGASLLRQRILRLQKKQNHRARHGLWLGLALLFQAALFSQVNSFVSQQVEEIEVYEYMATNHANSGKTSFCKSCTYETLYSQGPE